MLLTRNDEESFFVTRKQYVTSILTIDQSCVMSQKKSKRFAQEATIMKSNDYRQLGC